VRSIVLAAACFAAITAATMTTGCAPRNEEVATDQPHDPPNVILILVDALRRDHVGAYGYPKPTTPFMDELGAGGIVFDDALSQAPQTLNSTASLFTSRHFPFLLWGVEHDPIPGVAEERRAQWARTPRLAAANLTLAEVLGGAGYQTVALFNNPHQHPTSGFSQGFDSARLLDRDAGQAYARVDTVTTAFLDWHSNRDHGQPYFAYLHLMEPHNPYRPPAEYQALFPPGTGRHLYANGRPAPEFTDNDLETLTALYDAEIRFLDETLRSLVGELELRNDMDETLIIVTADHGDELLDHGGLGHGKTVELELLRIPLIMAGGPVKAHAGTRVAELARNIDLAPTIVEMAGLEDAAEFQGVSLMPVIDNAGSATAPPQISYAWIAKLRSLTSSEWHCMRNFADGRLTLYHRPTDPRGITDVSGDHPEIAELCLAELERLEAEGERAKQTAKALKAVETGGEITPESEAVLEQLKALGYVEE
jgi:arylsulfatase A-like enzyme